MSGFTERLRRALSSRPRPGVELVRVDPVDPPPPPRMRMPLALPAPAWPVCRRCGGRHEPRPLPGHSGQGLAAAYSQQLVDPGGARPIGGDRDSGDTASLVRDAFSPWRMHPAAVPPPPGPQSLREWLAGREP